MSRKIKAILLSALVLPGLGQLYLGKRISGTILILLVNLVILASLFVLMKVSAPVIAAKVATGKLDTAELLSVLNNSAGWGKAVLAGFAALWAYALVDLLRTRVD